MSHHIPAIRAAKQPYHWIRGLLANLLCGFPSRNLRVIGVTGTDGKTTTSTLIYHILKTAGKRVALISTVAAYIGDEEIDTGFHVTSPNPFALQKLLKRIGDLGYEYVVLEATSHGIFQHRLFGITPEIAVLTNITNEHLDYHASFDEYLKVKTSFLARAKTAYVNKYINKNDMATKNVRQLLQQTNVHVVEYGAHSLSQYLREVVEKEMVEEYNHENATAAILVALQLQVSEDNCARALASFPGVKGRMNLIPNDLGITAIVDFAHTPNALENALTALRARLNKPGAKKQRKLIAVFGCAGLRDNRKRPAMGKIASELADEAVFTAEDPRTEDVNVILRQIKEGVVQNFGHMHTIADRRQAIQFAINTLAAPGDIVGVFGKGHEKSMNLDGKNEVPWSDHEEVALALEMRREKKKMKS